MVSHKWIEQLHGLEQSLYDLGMENAFHSAKALKKASVESGRLDYDLLDRTMEGFQKDLETFDISHRRAILLLTKEMPATRKRKKDSSAPWPLNDDLVRVSLQRTNSNLDVLLRKFNSTRDPELQILLMGLGIILLYTSGMYYTKGLIKWLSKSMDHHRAGKVSESIFEKVVISDWEYYESVKDDPKWLLRPRSDVAHVRNAFAHSNYKMIPPDQIELWDVFKGGYLEYRRTFRPLDLLNMFNITAERLALLDTFVFLLLAMSTRSRRQE